MRSESKPNRSLRALTVLILAVLCLGNTSRGGCRLAGLEGGLEPVESSDPRQALIYVQVLQWPRTVKGSD